ncbi:MAG: histidine ammonia-lyase [Phycisphaerales bacterium]|jgi:histidine ammonia-lyase|nr:histidine ammonia-lyase [Phycisphaerales bacterium]
MKAPTVTLNAAAVTIEDVVGVARHGWRVKIDPPARTAAEHARRVVDDAAGGADPVYGINTGFGSLSQHRVEPDQVAEIQRNLLRSHAAGVGEPLDAEVVRAMMFLLLASLCRGHSGVRVEVLNMLAALLNHDVVPVVPCRGSVGASGDLAPLSHAALLLIGEGEAMVGDRGPMPGAEALAMTALTPLTLAAKEGLALINGTHLMAGTLALACHDASTLMSAATGSAAMSIDAARASAGPLDPRLHAARNQCGQAAIAAELLEALRGSQILLDHADDDPRVQDPYSFRCIPQVLGAARDALAYVRTITERELGGVTDNPLIFPEQQEILSGGNFHGMPLAIAADTAKIALCHVAGIAERRIYWLLSGRDQQNPLPHHLSPSPGLHSGLMITQYTAAALCNELQCIATPASVGNVPTSAGIEDYNSMGATSAAYLRHGVELTRQTVAIEYLVAAEGLEHQRPLRSGRGVEALHARVRTSVLPLTEDRPPSGDIAVIAEMILDGSLSEPS